MDIAHWVCQDLGNTKDRDVPGSEAALPPHLWVLRDIKQMSNMFYLIML